MRVLIIGGTGFIGSYLLRQLSEAGHTVAVFHRGKTAPELPREVVGIIGDRQKLSDYVSEFVRFAPDVVIDQIPYTEQEASSLTESFRGRTGRIVVISSQDVYRTYGLFLRMEEGELEPVPYAEDSPLRTELFPYREMARSSDDPAYDYDKILVEQVVMSEARLPATVLRLPKVYGPGDKQRVFEYVRRMDDGRAAILLGRSKSRWRWTRGYVENVSAPIALAVTDERAVNRIYNVGERQALTEAEWVQRIGQAAAWHGEVVAVDDDLLPAIMREPYRWEQHLVASTDRIRDELGYAEGVSHEAALERTVAWERTHPPSEVDAQRFDYVTEDAVLSQTGR